MNLRERILKTGQSTGIPGNQSKTLVSSAQLQKWALLTPAYHPPRLNQMTIIERVTNPTTELAFLTEGRTSASSVMALDFETTGDYTPTKETPAGQVVGVGLSDDRGSVYVDFRNSHPDTYRYIIKQLDSARVPLIAHNLFFDAGWIVRDFGIWLNWVSCTYALYKLIATEGFIGQEWGLKAAQKDLLLWQETNERELDLWLINNGFHQNTSSHEKQGYYFFPNWPVQKRLEPRWIAPRKAKMAEAPAAILGHYCALDADATYLIYSKHFLPALKKFEALSHYAGPEIYLPYIRIHIEQKLNGIKIDRLHLLEYTRELETRKQEQERKIIAHPEITPHVEEFNKQVLDELLADEPIRYRKQKELPAEPPKHTKSGRLSKNWEKWEERRKNPPLPEETLHWKGWFQKTDETRVAQHFNFESAKQLQWLIYERIAPGFEIIEDRFEPYARIPYQGRVLEVMLTKSSGLPTDEKALKQFGEVGALICEHKDICKLLTFCSSLDSITGPDSIYHPSFRVPGTYTGRLAGGGSSGVKLNIQAVPKDVGFLSCFIPEEGNVFVDCDHSALEQVVLAELSRDASLWKIYGPGAPLNDIYLFTGASLKGLGESIRASGYDPLSPTPESISAAKKACKRERAVAKTVVLASSYGAGPGKIRRTLQQSGIELSFEAVKEIHKDYWRIYRGVKEYEALLVQSYEDNSGWVLNGMGRPVGVAYNKIKDMVNRVVQSTGHDIHIFYLLIVEERLKAAGIPFNWIIADWHDATTVEVRAQDAEKVKQIMGVDAYEELNRILRGVIKLKGDAKVVRNLAESKCE